MLPEAGSSWVAAGSKSPIFSFRAMGVEDSDEGATCKIQTLAFVRDMKVD